MEDQGCLVDCVYCKWIQPELLHTTKCPLCHGKTPYFQSMRMMDSYTSRREILMDLLEREVGSEKENEWTTSRLLKLLTKINVYDFDLKQAIIELIQEKI